MLDEGDIGRAACRETFARRVVQAEARKVRTQVQYHYVDVVYCERPDIDRFVDMICDRKLVFEFTMHETASRKVRNPWVPMAIERRVVFDQLYALQVQLRGQGK